MPPKDGRVEVRLESLRALRRSELPAVTAEALRLWQGGHQPADIRVRRAYLRNDKIEPVEDERKPLPMEKRPPAARLIAPKGVALKLHLMLLFAAQCSAKPGKSWKNPYPVEPTPQSDHSWMGLTATVAKYHGPGIQGASVATNKRRQVTEALKKLEGLNLIRPTKGPGRGRQGFDLLHESGKSTPAAGVRYAVPTDVEPFVDVPREFFTKGWVQVLTTSEVIALLMWLDALKHDPIATSDSSLFVTRVTSAVRQGAYGLGREAYETHQQLDAFQLLDVLRPEKRHDDGKWQEFAQDSSDLACHRVTLTPEGFSRDAGEVVQEVLQRRDARGDWSRPPFAHRRYWKISLHKPEQGADDRRDGALSDFDLLRKHGMVVDSHE
ncbi:hypothetical protein ACFXJ6_16850 [Streptomyces sp. NPDC059218]|uniref:hypothetical protein n=1 Tax=unclassified Streptomyces TaxID=2593676 RepID=UPI003696D860